MQFFFTVEQTVSRVMPVTSTDEFPFILWDSFSASINERFGLDGV